MEVTSEHSCWIVIFVLLTMSVEEGGCLKCFECDNNDNPACGVAFKAYQFKPAICPGEQVKCGLQRQPPTEKNFIGILRRCYQLGMLGPGMNESDGCQLMQIPPNNYTFEMCFCSYDYCNTSPSHFDISRYVICAYFLAMYVMFLT